MQMRVHSRLTCSIGRCDEHPPCGFALGAPAVGEVLSKINLWFKGEREPCPVQAHGNASEASQDRGHKAAGDPRPMGGRVGLRAPLGRVGAAPGVEIWRLRWHLGRTQTASQLFFAHLGAFGQKSVTFYQEQHVCSGLGIGHGPGKVEGFRFKVSPALRPPRGLSGVPSGGVFIVCRTLIVRRHGAESPSEPAPNPPGNVPRVLRFGNETKMVNRTKTCGAG